MSTGNGHRRKRRSGDISLGRAVHNARRQKPAHRIHEWFHRFAHLTSVATGSPPAFIIAVLVIIIWAVSGPLFGYSDTWQLVINTGTTVVTFLMVFLIQNTQNRDAKAIHLKLDELIRAKKNARNSLVDLEDSTDEDLDRIDREFRRLRKQQKGG